MRKTGFFYAKKFLLAICLAWLAILNEAVSVNLGKIQEEIQALQEKAERMETEEVAEQVACEQETTDKTEDLPQGEAEKTQVRVLLMDTEYGSYYHPSVSVDVQGEEYTYTPESPELKSGRLILDAEEGICVTSISRQDGNPVYQGNLEIDVREEGLLLINEIGLEEYLKAVVPSEMPSSYPEEALKAQAVCARTYAYKQIQEGRLEEYGADVDDSVNFQVYRNISPQETTDTAVSCTEGEVICQDGNLIEAYYFSTSAGKTSTDEVWGAKEAASYLKSVPCLFDSGEPWSSWEVTIPWEQLQKNLETCTGETAKLKNIEITKKSQSGAVTGIKALTEKEPVLFSEEYSIREFLSPMGCTITGKDGSTMTGGNLLLSAYFTMDALPGESVSIKGNGYGHGVGMSQNAAKEMALEGYSYREILDYFFNNVEISQVSSISG